MIVIVVLQTLFSKKVQAASRLNKLKIFMRDEFLVV